MSQPQPTDLPVLIAETVSKEFPNGVKALRDVSLRVERGETLVLIGASGCGKSTCLRLFNGMTVPTRGTVRVRGERVDAIPPVGLRRSVGYVQQNGGLIPHWTVRRNVGLVPELLGWDAARIEDRTNHLLALTGLDPDRYGARFPIQLSGGERQRVAVARALGADPDIVLLDEPFGALDAITRRELQHEFLDLERNLGKTLLLVTHDLEEAFLLGSRVAVMEAGRIVACAAPDDLRRNPGHPYVERLLDSAGVRA